MDQKIKENEKLEMKELIDKYNNNLEKLNKLKRAIKQINLEQDEIKDKLKDFMKKNNIFNIFTQDGGKVIYQIQNVQPPLNKKFIEKRIIELVGEPNGKDLISKIFMNRDSKKRESIILKVGKPSGRVYV
jgi:butyrate kinase